MIFNNNIMFFDIIMDSYNQSNNKYSCIKNLCFTNYHKIK